MKSEYCAADIIWDPQHNPDADENLLGHLGAKEGWRPGMAPVAKLAGRGHPSHLRINGWPYVYIGTTADGDTLYQTY